MRGSTHRTPSGVKLPPEAIAKQYGQSLGFGFYVYRNVMHVDVAECLRLCGLPFTQENIDRVDAEVRKKWPELEFVATRRDEVEPHN